MTDNLGSLERKTFTFCRNAFPFFFFDLVFVRRRLVLSILGVSMCNRTYSAPSECGFSLSYCQYYIFQNISFAPCIILARNQSSKTRPFHSTINRVFPLLRLTALLFWNVVFLVVVVIVLKLSFYWLR